MTRLIFTLSLLISFVILLVYFMNPFVSLEVYGKYIEDASEFPETVFDGTQPIQGDKGVDHKVLYCNKDKLTDLMYKVEFNNPYTHSLKGVIATSLDGPSEGSIWAFFKVEVPSGKSNAYFNTSQISEDDRKRILNKVIPNIKHKITECSVHLLGFEEGTKYHVVSPVSRTRY